MPAKSIAIRQDKKGPPHVTQQSTQRQGCQVTQDSRQVDNHLKNKIKKNKNKKINSYS